MKWVTKGLQVVRMAGVAILAPAPHDEELGNINQDEEYTIEIKRKRKSRSLNANSFCWILCQKIAEKLSLNGVYHSREDVYRKAIKDCQHFTVVPTKDEAVEHFRRIWESNGIGWLTENMGSCRNTMGYSNIFAYHGSSVYDTEEMRRLIDCLIDEAVQIGVETKQVNEVNSLLDEWSANEQAKKG